MSPNVVIIDYGVGNISSVANMLQKVGASVQVSKCYKDVINADKILLSGVGHFDFGMKKLHQSGLIDPLNEFVLSKKKPILGICLGAQLLGMRSEEGVSPGLGWIDMECKKLPLHPPLRVPHMGWNQIKIQNKTNLFSEMTEMQRFYFVHSYYMECKHSYNSYAKTYHGIEFTSVVGKENIFGTQFHPEKSLKHGMSLMKSFVHHC